MCGLIMEYILWDWAISILTPKQDEDDTHMHKKYNTTESADPTENPMCLFKAADMDRQQALDLIWREH